MVACLVIQSYIMESVEPLKLWDTLLKVNGSVLIFRECAWFIVKLMHEELITKVIWMPCYITVTKLLCSMCYCSFQCNQKMSEIRVAGLKIEAVSAAVSRLTFKLALSLPRHHLHTPAPHASCATPQFSIDAELDLHQLHMDTVSQVLNRFAWIKSSGQFCRISD